MKTKSVRSLLFFISFAAAILVPTGTGGCTGDAGSPPATAVSQVEPLPPATGTAVAAEPLPTVTTQAPAATETPVPAPTLETIADTAASMPPFFYRDVVACGLDLPIITGYDGPLVSTLAPDAAALAAVLETLPEAARPALNQLLQSPQTVGLAAYRVGEEENGVYLNGDAPMPLASVVKIVHLIAYAEAAAAGELSPTETVAVEALDRFYLPTLDLRSHRDALAGLQEDGRIFGQPPALLLDEVARMMIEYSSNAATDYLHMALGQERIEETARLLELQSQTAPCPFVGQFLVMDNLTRPQIEGQTAVQLYMDDPQRYRQDVMQLTAAFSEDAEFHEEAISWRRETKRPDVFTQRLFSEQFNARGSAVEYAGLMARLALNDLGSSESSFIARRHLEWPMRSNENQELFSNLGYKGGSLPGILTTAYYAYPLGDSSPIVVALFYHDLHNSSYRQWRRSLAHDEFARWMLYEPQALPAMRALLSGAE